MAKQHPTNKEDEAYRLWCSTLDGLCFKVHDPALCSYTLSCSAGIMMWMWLCRTKYTPDALSSTPMWCKWCGGPICLARTTWCARCFITFEAAGRGWTLCEPSITFLLCSADCLTGSIMGACNV